MKATTLRTLAGVAAPLILTGSVQAGFTGISTTSKPNEFGLLVVNVYAEFEPPGDDHMLVVAGTPLTPLTIGVIGGTFYNHQFGTDRPPSAELVAGFPSLAFDSFVTIGHKLIYQSTQPYDEMVIAPDFPGVVGNQLAITNYSGWAVTASSPQGDPHEPYFPLFAPADGRVLLGQFSTLDGTAIQGTMLLQFISDGVVGYSVESFFVPGPSALWLLGAMGLVGRRRR